VPTEDDINREAQIVWDYHLMHHALRKSDCILVLCSNDPRVGRHGAQLYLDGWAPLLIFSGGVGVLTEGLYEGSEAEHFARIAIDMGVPEENLLIEPQSSNTGENIQFTRVLLAERGQDPQTFIVVQKPFMERRSFATFKQQWPDKDIIVSSPPLGYLEYPTDGLARNDIVHVMVGDLQRIREYPQRGLQIPQDIPDSVWSAYEKLVSWGFDQHLL
jgi:uncharacterized SAM-binding protein YcdF (DUF218 family)